MSKEIGGIVPIIPTPFRSDDSIHEQDLRRIVRWIGEHGAGGMCTPAYASEYYKLTDKERDQVVSIVIDENGGRVPVVAQANHGSASVAAATAARYEQMGADVISIAVPRMFDLPGGDVLRYLGRVADAISIPLLVQDFNPGGATISPTDIDELNRQHPNFKYLKLEEPLMIDKLVSIVDTVGDRVGVLEGWGGLYMLELIPKIVRLCGQNAFIPGYYLTPARYHYAVWTGSRMSHLSN
jgi:2-keto-3-deoxy-L-arabinonate dehydratase